MQGDCAEHLVKFSMLQRLDLSGSVFVKGCEFFQSLDALTELEYLGLNSTEICEDDLERILRSLTCVVVCSLCCLFLVTALSSENG